MELLCAVRARFEPQGVLIPGWGCYLFELVFDKLFLVRFPARTRPLLACCYCCCCPCSVLHPVLRCAAVASLTLVLTACVHVGCLLLQEHGGAARQREKQEWPFPGVSVFTCFHVLRRVHA